MESLTVLVVGKGAREHVLSEAYEKSSHVKKIIIAPGNAFMTHRRDKEVLIDDECSLNDPDSIVRVAQRYKPDMVDVAQDDALASGAVDLLTSYGFNAFGPSMRAAKLESDKPWSRFFMKANQIPSPWSEAFDLFDEHHLKTAKTLLTGLYDENPNLLLYVKAGGLCAGKGALSATSLEQALERIEQMKQFGEAGQKFVIEEGLVGEEFSCYAITDSNSIYIFKSAQDNKRALNFDMGEQTGGMGAVSPALVTAGIEDKIRREQFLPVIKGMKDIPLGYQGMIYLGGITNNGKIKNIEYNARWGDPECQVVVPGIKTDYVDIVQAVLRQDLGRLKIEEDDKVRVCVVGASKGYPDDYSDVNGKQIFGVNDAMSMEKVSVYGAGIAMVEGKMYAQGGRLFSIVGEGADIIEAKQNAYAAMACISIEGNNLHYRTDIGWRDVERVLKEGL